MQDGSNQQVQPGEVILNQGVLPQKLIILHKGTVSFRAASTSEGNISIENSKYIGSIEAPAVLGISALLLKENGDYYVITETPSTISVYPVNYSSLQKIIASKPTIAVLLLKTLLKVVSVQQDKFNSGIKFINYCINFSQSTSLAYSIFNPDLFKGGENPSDKIINRAKKYYNDYLAKGLSLPNELTIPALNKNYIQEIGPGYSLSTQLDLNELQYLKNFAAIDPAILSAICSKNPEFILLTAQKIAESIKKSLLDLNLANNLLKELAEEYFQGPYCWMEKMALLAELNKQNPSAALNNFASFFISGIRKINSEIARFWAINENYIQQPLISKIEQYIHESASSNVATNEFQNTLDNEFDRDNTTSESAETATMEDNITEKVLNWSEVSKETKDEFFKLMKEFKGFPDPMLADGDPRKVRRALINLYWKIFEAAILKYLRHRSDLPRYIEIFLATGLLDETLLEPGQVNYIYKNLKRTPSKYPIYDVIDWLTLIYEKKVSCSINELGLTYFELLRNENPDKKWKRESDVPANIDTADARVKFEIHNMIHSTVKLTSGSVMNYFPILTKYSINRSIENSFLNKKKLEDEINKLLNIDFSIFHREVLYSDEKAGINREFIQMQVIPNFIMVPSAGNVFQFWMDREGNNRYSPGRLVLPHIATEDLFDMLLHSVGAYKWELTKTILGPDWNNVSIPSITSEYTDYVQFFKKNRDLSPDMKEKLATEFKRFRDDRSRFINDYTIWIKYESEGTQKLNKIIRKILAKHIPFTKPIREQLLKLPAFNEIITKSINVKKRKAIELEPRYKKYRTDNNGILPQELENTIKFYNMEN